MKPAKQLLDAKQVAQRLSVSVKTVRRLLDKGELPAPVKIGRLLRWKEADIEAYMDHL